MSVKVFASRWRTSAENHSAGERIFNIFNHGGVLTIDHSPFGWQEDDLIDFKGYKANQTLIKNVTVKDADLSYSDFTSAWLEGNCFKNCLFVETDFSSASDHGNKFEHCVFLKCKFKLAALGYKGSQYKDCTFNKCSFQRAVFTRAEFVKTEFLDCRLKGVDFNASSFEECKFEGLLEDVWFRGTFPLESDSQHFGQPKVNKMLNVSFEKADLVDLTISDGCDLSTVKLPRNGKYFKYDRWLSRLHCLEKNLQDWDDKHQKNEASIFVRVGMVHAQKQDWKIINLDDLARTYGGSGVAAKVLETLENC